jgi:hypothetical protein
MPTCDDPATLLLDHTHCRAICDENGDRLRDILAREAAEIPPRLLALVDKLAELEIDGLAQLDHAPSIAPAIDDMSFCTKPRILAPGQALSRAGAFRHQSLMSFCRPAN